MSAKGIGFSSAPFTDTSPQASPAAVHPRNSSAAKTTSTSTALSFTIFADVPDGEDVVGIIEDLVAQQRVLMTALNDDISNLDISLQPLDNTDQDIVVVSFQNSKLATLFRMTLEPLLLGTQYTIGDAPSPSPGKTVRNLNFGQGGNPIGDISAKPIDISTGGKDIAAHGDATPLYGAPPNLEAAASVFGTEMEGAPGKKHLSPSDTSPASPHVHTLSTYMLFVSPFSIPKNWRITPANLTDTNKGVGSTVAQGDALGTAAFGKGKEKAESNTEADPPNSHNLRKRKANENLALHAQFMMALLRPPKVIEVEPAIPPSLLPAPEVYDAFKPVYDEARRLVQAVTDRDTQRGLFCFSLRTSGAAKFLPFHFLIGNLLDTKPIGLYIHSPKPSIDPSALAWNWQIHWIKLYFKSELEANTAFDIVFKQNAQLKLTMPRIPDWEVIDPLGNPIRNPNATE
jgi:hypothetical protein